MTGLLSLEPLPECFTMDLGRVWSRYKGAAFVTVMMFKLGFLYTAAGDMCLSSPCDHGATCVEHLGDYECLCPKGPVLYAGKNCEELFDACITAPCTNCTSNPGTREFTCHCPDGFTGLNCTQDGDKCQSNPCNGVKSHCISGINGYTCHCPIGLGGEDCRDNVTTCSDTRCQNGGTCVDILDTGHQCQCAAGYKGLDCEENIDDCRSEPCKNGAICKDGVNSYQCFCVPGFQGSHCDLDINECASRPCENNGTCLDEVDRYRCACAPGFTGINCEVEIDECEVRPCHNGALCRDLIATYLCECEAGFQGRDCEVNIDECASVPCLNNGTCIDGVNSYTCDCDGTGFAGDHCEDDIPECASNPCQHGASCIEGVNQYTCHCWPGYEGQNCQIDIDECEQHPCKNGGECFQRSDVQNYGKLPELASTNFSYKEAGGFLCYCRPGFAGHDCSVDVDECQSAPCQNGGSCQDLVNSYRCVCPDGFISVHCEVDINECDSNPCQNDAQCEDAANSYRCHCPLPAPGQEPWGGRDCDIRLVGCQQHQCHHEAGCVPTLTNKGEHGYTCLCPPGWTGEHCKTSTTFSFNSEGFVHMQLPVSTNWTGQKAHKHNSGLYMQLRFRTTLADMVLFFRGTEEHFVSLELTSGFLHARVKSGKVLQVMYPSPVNDGDWHQVTVNVDEMLMMTVSSPGCEEGCQVKNEDNNHLLFLQPSSLQQLYIGGAPQHYSTHTSNKRSFIGCMEDLHVDHKLLLPQDLIREENQGLELGCAKKDWCEEDPCMKRGHCVDMWINASCQCHRPYYGESCEKEFPSWTFGHENSSSHATFHISETHGNNFTISFLLRSLKRNGHLLQLHRDGRPYLTVYLKEGTVAVFSAHTTLLTEAKFVSDGNNHLVIIKVENGHVVFPKAGNRLALGNVTVEAGDVAFVGGLPEDVSVNALGGNFKGCLQDIRLDHKHLTMEDPPKGVEVYRAISKQNVLMGCQSDDTCKDEPCYNGGQCQITWNDFRCNCSVNYSGQLCETRQWCVANPCPDGVRCVNLLDGYECLTEATFQNNSLLYAANSSLLSPITNVTMNVRTRDQNGILLRAGSHAQVFCLGLLNSSVLVKLQSGSHAELVAFTSDRTVADGAWHHIQLIMVDPEQLESRWHLIVDGQRVGGSFNLGGNLNFLNDTKIWLAEKYTGCLGDVRVGGVYLPLTTVPSPPQVSRFFKLSGHEPKIGCRGKPVCDSNPCRNQGECQDEFNYFNCSCKPGWEGELCETEINECSSAPCVHGTCKDLLASYQCDCEPGYTGKQCMEELDDCLEFSCVNGGTCIEKNGVHTCLCLSGYIGKRCQWRYPPVACDSKTQCLNGGVCIGDDSGGNCTCRPGYTGSRCETEIDECQSSPCLNGATCLDRLNHFQCVCVLGFSGKLCGTSKEEHQELIPWLAVTIPLTTLSVVLAVLVVFFLIVTARKKRQSEGTYSPSSQEVAGARLEMGSVLKVPPEERLI